MKTNIPFLSYLAQFFLEWKVFQTNFVAKIETQILCSEYVSFENRAVYEIMWKDILERRMQMTKWCVLIACCITKDTNTHTYTQKHPHTHTHTHTHTHPHTHTHTNTHTHTYTPTHTHIYTHKNTHTHTHTQKNTHTHTNTHTGCVMLMAIRR